ncbi:undecaprenyl/decaprenyl-phosphate alpha-N-acetylglucosaminyl 1-phosphate transferase [bacterium]|nr:undecaprenyl/decaprenyl-phosphate alpha-N-acetylglucosaminyl 1-phosphate transferase [bacterium]
MYLLIYFITFLLTVILTPLISKIAKKNKIVDYPISKRKIHSQPIPLLGGLAVFFSFFIVLFSVYFSPLWPEEKISFLKVLPENFRQIVIFKYLIGVFVASSLLMIGGFLDDKYNLKPHQQIIWPILACFVIILSGIGIKYINNPFGSGVIHFDHWKFEIFRFHNIPFYFTPLADIFTFIWLMLCAYSTKLLDGLDGLVSGISVIGGLIIAFICLLEKFYQPDVAIISLIFSAAFLGFLIFNFHPAKIFLGEGGSLFAGFTLGTLAIISGAKIATALLILGIPFLDMIAVIIQRFFLEKRIPFSRGDKKHFHFRLLKAGFSHRQAVLFYWFVAAFFGLISVLISAFGKQTTIEKIIVLLFYLVTFSFIIFFLIKKQGVQEN